MAVKRTSVTQVKIADGLYIEWTDGSDTTTLYLCRLDQWSHRAFTQTEISELIEALQERALPVSTKFEGEFGDVRGRAK